MAWHLNGFPRLACTDGEGSDSADIGRRSATGGGHQLRYVLGVRWIRTAVPQANRIAGGHGGRPEIIHPGTKYDGLALEAGLIPCNTTRTAPSALVARTLRTSTKRGAGAGFASPLAGGGRVAADWVVSVKLVLQCLEPARPPKSWRERSNSHRREARRTRDPDDCHHNHQFDERESVVR